MTDAIKQPRLDGKAEVPSKTTDYTTYRPEDFEPQYRWQGEGPPPRRWRAADGTVVYRSYADYCDD